MKKYFISTLQLALISAIIAIESAAATQLSQFGITWKFSQNVQYGQYANGDYWVVGPVNIIEITPISTVANGRTINGSMVNPSAREGGSQGFDSAMYAQYGPAFDATLNVARPGGNTISAANPLVIAPNSSLISTISHPTAGNRPQLTDAAVLTIVSAPPPAGSFRPPYQGTDKTHRWNQSSLNFSILKALPKTSGIPSIASLENNFSRPWIEINTSWIGRYMHPSNNQPDYGRDIAILLGSGLLSLHADYTNDQKRKLYTNIVQIGLDFYGAARTGAQWRDLGGHNQGRKMPMILAGLSLNDSSILAYADASKYSIFQEDRQTWIVSQNDVGRTLYTADGRPRVQYLQSDIGIAEWGEQHTSQPNRDGRNWDAYYRDIVGSSVVAHALFAHLTPGAKEAWNWEPFFRYMDRFFELDKERTSGGNTIPSFHRSFWTAYRDHTANHAQSEPPRNARITLSD